MTQTVVAATRWSSAPEPRYLEDVSVGDELPVMIKHASRAQLFLYSAATWNPHRIHYDRDYALVEGHPDVIVHGPLQGAWLTQYVTDWAGPAGRLLSAGWQNRASALPERDLRFTGRVSAIEDDVVRLEIAERDADDGRVLMPGWATVRLPRRG
jgi:hydroxyacyl-ACP dehydratase HTD2-like protein with hotdog domain